MKFTPSFNLRTNQKSTPKNHPHHCDDVRFQIDSQSQTVPTHSTYSRQNKNVCSTQNKTKIAADSGIEIETQVDVHANDSENDTTFHSL